MTNSRFVRAACRVHELVTRALPAALRRRFASEMRETFRDACVDARRRGRTAVARLLAAELVDIGSAAMVARRARTPPLDRRREEPMGAFLQDVRYALRMMRRQPAFAAIAVLTLALGVGANTAVFTVVNGVLLKPLPYRDPDQLVVLLYGRSGRMSLSYSPPNYLDATSQSNVFESFAAINGVTSNLTGLGDPERVQGAEVTPAFFTVLGVAPRLGRAFLEADVKNGGHVVVLTDAFWRRRFGARPDIVGSTVQMDGTAYTIVGVAPPELQFPRRVEFWRVLAFAPKQIAPSARGAQWITVVARLKPGVTLDQANASLAVVAARLGEQYPNTNQDHVMAARLLHEQLVQGIRPALLVLLGAVALVLLIACVNVANLLLARAYGRAREVAVRAALGAGRARLIRQFLAESLVVAVCGGVAGLVVAFWCTRALIALGPTSIPRLGEVTIDWRVLAFTAGTAVAASVLFGLAPAFASTGSRARVLGSAGRGSVGASGTMTRKSLVVAELALALVLLVGAGLLLRSYERLLGVDPGFSPEHVLTFHVALPDAKYPDTMAAHRFTTDLVSRLEREPGVQSAAGVLGLPFDSDFQISSSFTKPGEVDSANTPSTGMRVVTPDYFAAMKIPLRAGRTFDAHDDETGPEVVIINEQAAHRFWPGQNPIGQQVRLGVRLAPVRSGMKTIVGVVGDVKYGGLDEPAPPEMYLPHAQQPVGDLTLVVRTAADPLALVPAARADLAAIDRELPLADIHPMTDLVGRSVAERRFTMLLLVAFALVAVALAGIGIYGLLAYVVTQRTPEIGVRLAMGASPADVVRLFVREGAALIAISVVVGVAGALAAGRALTALLFGISASDPATLIGVAVALAAVALTASWLPARRAARVDPMNALRAE